MKPVILFRNSRDTEEEYAVAHQYFRVENSRVRCANSLVIARYSALPFYHELERDLREQGSQMINTHLEHQYVANLDYYDDVRDLTAQTWFELKDVPKDSGPWIVKGRTNSRKQEWRESMFANTWEDLVNLYYRLSRDHLLGPQGLVIRKYWTDLELIEEGLTQPMFNEWRYFFYKGRFLSRGYYWTSGEKVGRVDFEGDKLAQEIANRVADKIPFVVIDIARKQDGSWVLIELNDGQMSGLSDNEPHTLYTALAAAL